MQTNTPKRIERKRPKIQHMKLHKDDRREEMAAYGTMILISTIGIGIVISIIFELWKHL